jgi:hypothetical protein
MILTCVWSMVPGGKDLRVHIQKRDCVHYIFFGKEIIYIYI